MSGHCQGITKRLRIYELTADMYNDVMAERQDKFWKNTNLCRGVWKSTRDMNQRDATREWLIMWCAAIASNSSAKYDAKIKSIASKSSPLKTAQDTAAFADEGDAHAE